jgi:hypothetical protein
MRLSNQAVGALMMALQRVNPEDSSHTELVVTNPPTINFDNVELNEEG